MADNEITVLDNVAEGVGTANVDTKSLIGVGGKTVNRQAIVIASPVTFGRVAEVNANSELLVKHTDSISISNSFATEATLAIISGNLSDIETLITTLNSTVSTQTTLASILLALDGVEASLTSLDGKDYATQATLALIKAKTDNLDVLLSTTGSTEYTEDVPSVADPIGTQVIARRRDALATETTLDGDNTALNSTGKGELYVKHVDSIPVTSATLATEAELATKLDEATFTTRVPVNGQAVMASSIPVVVASNQSAIPVSGTVTANVSDNAARDNGKIDIAAFDVQLPAGTNNIGDVDVLTLPNVAQATSANLKNEPNGHVAHDAVDSGNPLKVGGRARTANIASVAQDDRVDFVSDKNGRQIIVAGCQRELRDSAVNASAITNTTETTIIAAVASEFHDIESIIISNSSAVATLVQIRDVAAGTVLINIYSPAGSTVGVSIPNGLPQTTVNTAWTAQAVTTGSSLFVTMTYVKNV